jgi:anti-sigma factor RsiW
MNEHLSSAQLAKSFVDGPSGLELQHITGCAQCRAELDRLGEAVSSFRSAVRARVDAQVESTAPGIAVSTSRLPTRAPKWVWLWGGAAVAGLVLVPFFVRERKSQEPVHEAIAQEDADALMGAINLHLMRTVPAPMEPILGLVPSAESKMESGGDQ